jgi:Immunity protein 52
MGVRAGFRSCGVWAPIVHPGGSVGYKLERTPMIPSEPTFPESVFHIPWIAYLSAPHAIGVNLSPEIMTERTPDGGLLMSATKERLDPDKPEHVRRARNLAETLIAQTGRASERKAIGHNGSGCAGRLAGGLGFEPRLTESESSIPC